MESELDALQQTSEASEADSLLQGLSKVNELERRVEEAMQKQMTQRHKKKQMQQQNVGHLHASFASCHLEIIYMEQQLLNYHYSRAGSLSLNYLFSLCHMLRPSTKLLSVSRLIRAFYP